MFLKRGEIVPILRYLTAIFGVQVPPSTLFFIEPFKLGSILVFNSRTREAQHARKASDMRLGRPKGKGKSKLDEHSGEINRLVVLGVPQKHYC